MNRSDFFRAARIARLNTVCLSAVCLAVCLTVCLGAVCLFAGTAKAAPAPVASSPLESARAEAAALLEKGDAAGAYDMYMRLTREAPGDDAVTLGLARSAARAGRWNQAVMAYERLLEKHPREAALYGELGNVYMLLGDRVSAERSLAMLRALQAGVSPADTDFMLDTLESRYNPFQAHGKVRMGVLYDSNANMGPRSSTMDLGSWRVRAPGAREKETFGAYVGGDLHLGWRTYRDSPWWLVGDAQFYLRGNANNNLKDNRGRSREWGRAGVGLRHLTPSTLTEVRLKTEVFDYEFYQNVTASGPEVQFVWAVTPKTHLITQGGLDWREYSRDSERNGLYGWAGEYLRLYFGAADHEFLAGVKYLGASADRNDYGYHGLEASARFLFKLPYGFEAGPFAAFTLEDYNGPATALESKDRQDERWRLGTLLTYRINESWALECAYQYAKNNSESALYDYKQHLVTTGVVWSF